MREPFNVWFHFNSQIHFTTIPFGVVACVCVCGEYCAQLPSACVHNSGCVCEYLCHSLSAQLHVSNEILMPNAFATKFVKRRKR